MADARSTEAGALAPSPSATLIPDPRGGGRWMRVTWHDEADLVVLSLWRASGCIGTMRVARADVPDLVNALVEGLAAPHTETALPPLEPLAPEG